MNFLFYYGRPLKKNDGGIACITLSLIQHLSTKGHTTMVLSREGVIDESCLLEQYVLPSSEVTGLENIEYLKKLITNAQIDVIINQIPIDDESEALLIKVRKLCGIRIISCFHNPITLSAKNIAYRKEYKLSKLHASLLYRVIKNRAINYLIVKGYIYKNRSRYRNIINNSDISVVLCEGMRSELEEMVGIEYARKKRIIVIPNFLINYPNEIPVKEKLIVWCGHIDFDIKRIDVILRFWDVFSKYHSDWSLSILGDGPCVEEAMQLSKRLGLSNVSFEGRVKPDNYYRRASFAIITSSYESFSLVTLEAMSFGCVPVVFNTFPAASFIINDKKVGLLVEPYDLISAKRRMEAIIQSVSVFKEYSNNAYTRSQSFNVSEIGKIWEEVLTSIQ